MAGSKRQLTTNKLKLLEMIRDRPNSLCIELSRLGNMSSSLVYKFVNELHARGLIHLHSRRVSITFLGQEALAKNNMPGTLNSRIAATSDRAERIRIYQDATMSA